MRQDKGFHPPPVFRAFKRADDLRAGKRKRSPSSLPQGKQNYRTQQAGEEPRVRQPIDQAPTLLPTNEAAATTKESFNLTYQRARTPSTGRSETVRPLMHPHPKAMMIGSPPTRKPARATATKKSPTSSAHQHTQTTSYKRTSGRPLTSDRDIHPTRSPHLANPTVIPTEITSYDLAPPGQCMAWDDVASIKPDKYTFSENPGADFEVRRSPFDPVSSTFQHAGLRRC